MPAQAGIQSHGLLLSAAGDVDSRRSTARGQVCVGVTSWCFARDIRAGAAMRVGARAYVRRLAALLGMPTEFDTVPSARLRTVLVEIPITQTRG